jgi:hypothetical protein
MSPGTHQGSARPRLFTALAAHSNRRAVVHNNPAEAVRNNRVEAAGNTPAKGRATKVLRPAARENPPAGWKAERRDPAPQGD